jgi:hypothetical protein
MRNFRLPLIVLIGIACISGNAYSQTNDNFIYHPGTQSIAIGFAAGEDKIDGNYWADNSTTTFPFAKYTPLNSSVDLNFKNISYNDNDHSSDPDQTTYYSTSGVSCSSGIPDPISHKGKDKPLSIANDTSLLHCEYLYHIADSLKSAQQYQKAYDGYKAYIESCAYFSDSYSTFSDVGTTNTKRTSDNHRDEEYREWLKKVLYYNIDTNYYCADVGEILSTFGWFNDSRGRDWRGALTVLYFLVKSNKCPTATAYLDTVSIPADWRALYSSWQDSVIDPVKNPFDSTLPSLDDLNLGILRGQPSDVKKFIDSKLGPIIGNIHASQNPFSSETKIEFTCREAVALKFEIFDVLGKKVYDGGNKVYDEGENQILLPGAGLPHGELFARFSASDGTVKTIKLIHE